MILGFYGASGLGMEYLYLAEDVNKSEQKWDDFVFIDDNPEKDNQFILGKKIMSFEEMKESYKPEEIELIISLGEPAFKDAIFKKIKDSGYKMGTLIHPTSTLGADVEMGEGVVIQSYNRIPPMSKIGNNVLIQGTTCLGHGVVFGDNSVISSFDFIGGATVVGKNTYVAPHSCLRNGIKIGENVVIGMGSVVTKDIPDNAVAFGNPCEVKRMNDKGRVFSK